MNAPPGYELERLLGKGGFSEVWLALRTSDRTRVALKFVKNPEHAKLLRDEARSLALVRGDGVLQVLALELDHDPPFLVVEYAAQGDLRGMVAREKPTHARAIQHVENVLAVLARVHREGVVHGDLKPENVLFDLRGRVLLADFGLSRRIVARTTTLAVSLSHADAKLAGTIDYMAPEQRAGEKPTPASDVYAVGVILHELLLGERPQGVFHAPSERLPHLPPHVDRVLLRALAADPAERYPSASAFLSALRLGRWIDAGNIEAAIARGEARVQPLVIGPALYASWAVPYWLVTLSGKFQSYGLDGVQAACAAAATLAPCVAFAVGVWAAQRACQDRLALLRTQLQTIRGLAGSWSGRPRAPRSLRAWFRARLALCLPARARRVLLARRAVLARAR